MEDVHLTSAEVAGLQRIILTGMGTSFHACLVGKYLMESLTGIPTEAENASELRYRDAVIDGSTLVVSVGQSGETADTLSAMEEARSKGARLLTVCNVEGSQATRLAEGGIQLRAGLEIGVASTKTFLCSMEALYILALFLGSRRGFLAPPKLEKCIADLAHIPELLGNLVSDQRPILDVVERHYKSPHFLYLGRGLNYPIALEGALKLKEISYIHAEGGQAGEIKHGPIALVDENMPVVALAPADHLRDKMANNIAEISARGGKVIVIATEGDEEMGSLGDQAIYVPATSPLLTPLLTAVPLQLLAYHLALKLGRDVDQPRNLAKSVTVE